MAQKAKGRPEFYYDEARGLYRKRIKLPSGATKDVRAKTKAELRKKLHDMEHAIRNGIALDDDTTVAELAAEWYQNRKHKWGYSRQLDYANAINKHICPVIGSMKLKSVKSEHCQRILSNMAGMSNSSQHKVVTTLKQIFGCAEENGLVFRSPCTHLKAGGIKTQEKVPLTPEQSQRLVEAVQGTKAHLFVLLALYAGLRREEICGLRWSDIDLNADTPSLTVTHVVRFEGNKGTLSSTLKSDAAHRTIPIPTPLAIALHNAKKSATSVFVVPAKSGSYATGQTIRSIMAIVERRKIKDTPINPDKKKPGPKPIEGTLDFDVTPHQLRHTYITRLCESGMDVKKVQYLAGHSTVNLTLSIYAHVTNNKPEQLIGAIEKAFAAK